MKDIHRKPLFIFELANNHMGCVEHGLRVIREIHAVTRDFSFNFGFKFQYRQLNTFIHPQYRERSDVKHIKRFMETNLQTEHFMRMKAELDALGFVTICTPFDEPSVELIQQQQFDFIKVASCSVTDWPLLEEIAKTPQPVIISTAGADLEELDKVVSFFQHRKHSLCVMHCVGIYPTPPAQYQLDRIVSLRERYPKVPIGYSTHEAPADCRAVQLAIAKGAQLFEKHVGVATDKYKLNAYSASPEQVRSWLSAAKDAFEMCAITDQGAAAELATLRELRRGVFARKTLPDGTRVTKADIFLAMPTVAGQLTANDLSKYVELTTVGEVGSQQPLLNAQLKRVNHRERIYQIVQQVKGLLKKANVVVPGKAELEISHHYGIERFDEYGLTMITCVNRDYCKKLLVMLPGQKHPEQYHKIKEETFQLLHGDLQLQLNHSDREFEPGDAIVVERETRHAFSTREGCIIEEISSRHIAEDSYYTDPAVSRNPNRKTRLTYWMS